MQIPPDFGKCSVAGCPNSSCRTDTFSCTLCEHHLTEMCKEAEAEEEAQQATKVEGDDPLPKG